MKTNCKIISVPSNKFVKYSVFQCKKRHYLLALKKSNFSDWGSGLLLYAVIIIGLCGN